MSIFHLLFSVFCLFWKNISRLMRSPCCLCACVSTLNTFWMPEPILWKCISWREQGWRSRYNEWLLAERPRCRCSSPGGGKNFHFSTSSRPALGPTQPPIQWIGNGALSPRVKRQGCEADHSPATSVEVKKMWIYTSTPPYAFMA
jgi:hypothetical protein